MKRKLFFLIDKLQIQRSERIVLGLMMGISLMLGSILVFVDFSPNPDDYDYSELERVFNERSAAHQQEREAILARYKPLQETEDLSVVDEIEESNVKTIEIQEHIQEIPDTIRININKADADELQELPGIGPAYASRIVEWRKEHGEFTSVEQLLEIRGIGPARLENIRPLVVL